MARGKHAPRVVRARRNGAHGAEELIRPGKREDDLVREPVGDVFGAPLAHPSGRQGPRVGRHEATAVIADVERWAFGDRSKTTHLRPKPRPKDRLGELREARKHARVTVVQRVGIAKSGESWPHQALAQW